MKKFKLVYTAIEKHEGEVVVEETEYPIISMNQWDVRSILGYIGTGNEIEVSKENMELIAEKASEKVHSSLGDTFWELFHDCIEDAVGEVYEGYIWGKE